MTWIVTPDKFLSEEEVKRLVQTCSQKAEYAEYCNNWIAIRDWMIIDLALNTGLRVSELADLNLSDLHIEYGQSALTVQNGKGNKKRMVRFGSKVKAHLKNYLKLRQHKKCEYLFTSILGDKISASGIQKIFKKCAADAGLSNWYSIHSLRHTAATRLYKASGNNLRLVQKQLGHSSIATTQVYADVMDEDVEEALRKLEE
jgi:site-specific recombinase XerD